MIQGDFWVQTLELIPLLRPKLKILQHAKCWKTTIQGLGLRGSGGCWDFDWPARPLFMNPFRLGRNTESCVKCDIFHPKPLKP